MDNFFFWYNSNGQLFWYKHSYILLYSPYSTVLFCWIYSTQYIQFFKATSFFFIDLSGYIVLEVVSTHKKD